MAKSIDPSVDPNKAVTKGMSNIDEASGDVGYGGGVAEAVDGLDSD